MKRVFLKDVKYDLVYLKVDYEKPTYLSVPFVTNEANNKNMEK